jgi:hypothetical protein
MQQEVVVAKFQVIRISLEDVKIAMVDLSHGRFWDKSGL